MIERKNGNFFAAISEVKARQKAFLDYVAKFYNLNNRAEKPEGGCVYHALDNSPGCAIGQFLPLNLQKNCVGAIDNVYYYQPEYFNQFPDWMREMGFDFLLEIQRLHDYSSYWDENGISEIGQKPYARIVERFDLF
jgi:hypothetical protein